MRFGKPVTDIIEQRFSCRTYLDAPIEEGKRHELEEVCASLGVGPFGTPARFKLVAATEEDTDVLKGLGTYGFIRGATGFILGAVGDGDRNLEDFGYLMEQIVLFATDLGLGSCWLGGTFTKSRFAARMEMRDEEMMPAIISVGHISDKRGLVDRLISEGARSKTRYPWGGLFFDRHSGVPLSREAAGAYAVPLEMVRLGPSASNKQPWRVIKNGDAWHHYLQRSPRYRERNWQLSRIADMQRIDMGIALCHFELTARESGLLGRWIINDPGIARPDDRMEYTASWMEDRRV
jgi:nitroreductase